MKKTLLLLILCITTSLAYTITDGTLAKYSTATTTTSDEGFSPQVLPSTYYDVTEYGLKCDGTTDDSPALKVLASNTNVTNWYIPPGKTCRLYGISVPEHVKAIFGGGSIKEIVKDTTYAQGPIHQVNAHSGYVIDGITFVGDGQKGSSIVYMYGFVALASTTSSGGGAIRNIEIRNCYFDATNNEKSGDFGRDGIIIYGDSDVGSTRNVWIHNNTFKDIKGAGMEILHRSATVDPDGVNQGLHNVLVENNDFDGRGWCGISISQVRNKCVLRNNKFHGNWKWAFELNQAKDVYVYNNEATEIREDHISIGGTGWHTAEYDDLNSPNTNYVYQNHFDDESARIHMYGGSSTHIYDNYIRGTIHFEARSGNANGGIIENNTHVQINAALDIGLNARAVMATTYDTTNYSIGTILYQNNDVYSIGSWNVLMLNSTMNANDKFIDNRLYTTGTVDCISVDTGNSVLTGNTCTENYSGTIPSSRSGAGLSDPDNIGIQ